MAQNDPSQPAEAVQRVGSRAHRLIADSHGLIEASRRAVAQTETLLEEHKSFDQSPPPVLRIRSDL